MKVDMEIMDSVLSEYSNKIDMETRVKILRDIEKEAEENKPEREKKPKKRFVAVAITDNPDFENVPLFLTQIEEGDNHNFVVDRIVRATEEHNNTPKGRKKPIRTFGDAFAETKRKMITDKNVWIKTKEPVIIVRTEKNEIDFD